MRDHKDEKPYRQSKSIKDLFKSHGVHALLLAAVLGSMDIVVISGVRPADQISEWIVPLRTAVLLTIGTLVLTVGAVSSFLSSLRRDRTAWAGGEQDREKVAGKETDTPDIRSKAA